MAKRNDSVKTGQLITVPYKSREIEAIVIDPNGLELGQPIIGFCFGTIEKHIGIPAKTLSDLLIKQEDFDELKLPSGKTFTVFKIGGEQGNSDKVVEAGDLVVLAADLSKHPGKTRKNITNEAIDSLSWFDVESFYAQAYKVIKHFYRHKDSRALQLKQQRELGIPPRKDYCGYIESKDGKYGTWTNIVYQGLFGLNAAQIKQIWATQAGNPKIARNHIPKASGIEAIAHCERLVVMLGLDDIGEAHTEAIRLTIKKFGFDRQDLVA